MRSFMSHSLKLALAMSLFLTNGCETIAQWRQEANADRERHIFIYAIDLTSPVVDKRILLPRMAEKFTANEVGPGDEVQVVAFGGSGRVYTQISTVSLSATGNEVFDRRLALVSYGEIGKAMADACALNVADLKDRTSDQFAILSIAKDAIAADPAHRSGVIVIYSDGWLQTPHIDTRSTKLNEKNIKAILHQLKENGRLPNLTGIDLVIAGAPGSFDTRAGAVTDLFFGLKLFWTEVAAQMHANLRGFGQMVPSLGYGSADK